MSARAYVVQGRVALWEILHTVLAWLWWVGPRGCRHETKLVRSFDRQCKPEGTTMLRVTIELISAITHRTSTLGTMFLSNDGKGTPDRGNYDVRVMRKGVTSPLGKATREGRVEDYPRLAYNVWRLVARGLLAAFPEERTPGIAKLDAKVMAGLNEVRSQLEEKAFSVDRNEFVRAACAWLDAGNADPDLAVESALGCNMPEGDARVEFQRSIFRGLKLLASGRDCDFTDEERADIANARKFIDALPV